MKKKKPVKKIPAKKIKKSVQKENKELKKQIQLLKKKLREKEKRKELEDLLREDIEKEFKRSKKKPVPKKKKKLSDYIYEEFERELFEEELSKEIASDIEKIIKKEFKKIDYDSIDRDKLKYEGRSVSREFNEFIVDVGKASNKHPQDLLDDPRMKESIDNFIEFNQLTTFKTIPALLKYLKKEDKNVVTIKYEDQLPEQIGLNELAKRLSNIEQDIRKEKDIVYFGIKTIHRTDGEFVVFLLNDNYDSDELEEFLNSDVAEYLIYEEKG